ncbi:MAG: serine hydrolase domain-containing protein [Henriciella sp.]|uniref:serine hydrolase domain-containing protein n=1 Tax=Henriciella sp. TaxID=1968823 RepID=UPI0032EB3C06
MLKSTSSLIAAAVLLASCAANEAATALPETWPPLGGEQPASTGAFDPAGLEALSAAMQGYVDDGHVIGMQTLLVKDSKVIQHGSYGVMDVETAAPVSDDTIYRIYSMTKPITGVALMQLHEEGKFELDDPVTDYIPEFETLKVLAGENEDGSPKLVDMERPPTMRELMTHTAGFAYGLGGGDYVNQQYREQGVLASPDMQTFIDKVAAIPLLFQPGERWYYSAAVDVQGYLVEKFSGMSFGDYLDANVFDPLNMDDTGFYVPEEDYQRLADLTVYNQEEGKFVPMPTSPETQSPSTTPFLFRKDTISFESGGGGLVSTLDDYARFSQMMLNKGELSGQRILEPETVELMTTNQLPEGVGIGFDGTNRNPEEGERHKFGLDFGLISDPEAMNSPAGTGTYYWGGAAGTWFWIDPENNLFFIGMIQRFGALPGEEADFRGRSGELVYEALEE